MKKICVLVMILLVMVSLPAFASEIKSIDVVSEEWVNCTNSDGTGLYFDLLRLVYEPYGIKVNTKNVPYARSTRMVKNGQADVVVGPYLNEVDNVIYPKTPFSGDRVVALMKQGKVANWQRQQSIKNKRVAWIRGYAFGDYIDVPMNSVKISNRKQAIRMLQGDRIDFFLGAPSDIINVLEKMNVSRSAFTMKDVTMLHMYMGFINSDKGEKLVEIWNQKFKKKVNSGQVKKLFKKYNSLSDYKALIKSYQF